MADPVLIVDDSPVIRLTLKRYLQQHGFPERDIHVAESGEDAMGMFEDVDPRIVFMDMMMPDMDGEQAASLMLREDPLLKVVVVTGLDPSHEKVRNLVSLGAFSVLDKPIRSKDVASVLDEIDAEEGGGMGRIK